MNRPITPPPSCSPCSSSGPSSPESLSSLRNEPNDCLLRNINGDSSYEDVLSLIQEAKAVSDSIDHSLQDMKLHFLEMGDSSWKSAGDEDEDADCSLLKKKTSKKTVKKVKKDKKEKQKKAQPLKTKTSAAEPVAPAPIQPTKKTVRFAPPTDLCQIQYMDIPSFDCQERLSFTSEEQQDMILQLQQDVEDLEDGRPDFYYECGCAYGEENCRENEEYTGRGLEQRTIEGQEIRIEWRSSVRDSVLDEQERQWLELPVNEPCDVYDIAQVSLVLSRESKDFARQLALQDEMDVYGLVESDDEDEAYEYECHQKEEEEEDTATVVTALSETSWNTTQTNNSSGPRVNRLSWSLASLVEDEEEDSSEGVAENDEYLPQDQGLNCRLTRSLAAAASEDATTAARRNLNSKGCAVQWPDEQQLGSSLEQVHSYDLPLARLSEDDEDDEDDSESDRLLSYPAASEEKARFHFATPQEEEQYQQVRLQMFLQVYDPCHQHNPDELAKKCSEISAHAKRSARQRAMKNNKDAIQDDDDKDQKQPKEEKSTTTTAPTTTTRRRGGLASRLSHHPSLGDDESGHKNASSGDKEDLNGYLRALYSEEEELLHSYHKENSMTWDI